jgi:plasmid stability protein
MMKRISRMTDLSVRVPNDLAKALEQQAAANGRSVETEHRRILQNAVAQSQEPWSAEMRTKWAQRAKRLREEIRGRAFTPSEGLIREMRDEH